MTDDIRQRLLAALEENRVQRNDLTSAYDGIVAASRDANTDDEHDPEGATIAFERQQVRALRDQADRTRSELARALALLDAGDYGTCEQCGGAIGAERLEARPNARTCMPCESSRPRGNPPRTCR